MDLFAPHLSKSLRLATFVGFIGPGQLLAQCELHEDIKITAYDAAAGDFFGSDVVLISDELLVGAVGDDCTAGNECGSAYIYRFENSVWVQRAKLTASDAKAGDYFSAYISRSDDVIMVGAPLSDCAEGDDCGSVYVYSFDGTSWVEQPKLVPADPAGSDRFGGVAVSGDWAIVGSYWDDCPEGAECGSAYVFHFNGMAWVQTQKLTSPDADQNECFGYAVSLSGDTAVVTAVQDDCSAGLGCGAAHVFRRVGESWIHEAKLTASDGMPVDWFGHAVFLSGDLAIVGAYLDACANATAECGAAYVFRRSGSRWAQEAKLTAFDAAAYDQFGNSVSLSGDTAVVGSLGDDCLAGGECGSAYVFRHEGSGWVQKAKLTASDRDAFDLFGYYVSISDDVVAIGARHDDCTAGDNCGSVYIFNLTLSDCNNNGIPDECDRWRLRSVVGPAARFDHTMTFDAQRKETLLFGGSTAVNDTAETWAWNGVQWTLRSNSGPPPRDEHGMAFDSQRSVAVIFGGNDLNELTIGDTWEWDGNQWSERTERGPSPRKDYAMVYDAANGVTVLFGGTVEPPGEDTNETWLWDGTMWTLCPPIGTVPAARHGHALAFDSARGVVVMFGGSLGTTGYNGDTWELDGCDWTLKNSAGPSPRNDHAMAFDEARGVTLLFGGVDLLGLLGDTWEWNGSTWVDLQLSGPSPREEHGLAYDTARRTFVLFSGVDPAFDPETWELPSNTLSDCNNNGIPDECDIANCPSDDPSCQDCNGNGVPDGCEHSAIQLVKLVPSDVGGTDHFGVSVSISEQVLVIGSAGDDCPAGTFCGSSYVFTGSGSKWTQAQKLTASDADDENYFGFAVSVGNQAIIVGAYGADCPAGLGCGSAYVFRKNESGWAEEQKLSASDADENDSFGYAVDIDGNVAVVGAFTDRCQAGFTSGSAYVFRFDGSKWEQEQKLFTPACTASEYFGYSVAVSSNVIVVGAPSDDCATGSGCGAAYVFRYDGLSWVPDQKLVASDASADDFLGSSVSISSDLIVLGAGYSDSGVGNDSGSAYVFRHNSLTWVQEQKLTAFDALGDDRFGDSVYVDLETVVVGAFRDDCAVGSNCGSAYVFQHNGAMWIESQKLTASDLGPFDYFGSSVSIAGSVIVVGADYNECLAGDDCGSTYIYTLADCNGNDIPDECEPDCNLNLIPDECDIADCPLGDSSCQDCNSDGVPDECVPTCGDGVCTLVCGENQCTCPADCGLLACVTDAECDDFDACTCDFCVCNACLHQPREYGDVTCNCGPIDVDDILCVLDCFSSSGAVCLTADIDPPCTGDGDCDVDDILAVLDAFAGINHCLNCDTFCPLGACCSGSDCRVETEAQCLLAGDLYKGDGTACPPLAPDPCP